jgi:DNA-binding IclR family transcriptional regulator
VVQILECFTSQKPELTFTELVACLDLHKSTLYRLLEAMRSHGLVEQDRETGKYQLGVRLFEFGMLAVDRLEISTSAKPALEKLVEQTGETAHLCIFENPDVVYVAKVESKQTLRMPSHVGRRNPAYCTGVGKAILAELSADELETYLSHNQLRSLTKKTIVTPAELKKQLNEIRLRGYSLDDEEISEGLRCVGAAVRDYTGKAIAAVSIAGPSIRITKSRISDLAASVVEAADSISEQFGYQPRKVQVAGKNS